MGKHNNRRKKGGNRKNRGGPNKNNIDGNNNTTMVLLQNLRSPQPQLRHAALTGLTAADMWRNEKLAAAAAAIGEIVANDVHDECVFQAATCMARHTATTDDCPTTTLSAWLTLATARLAKGQSTAAAEPLLLTICHLLEYHPAVTIRRLSDRNLLQELASTVAHILDSDNGHEASLVTLACRCCHSAWEEQPALYDPWLSDKQTVWMTRLNKVTRHSPAALARLHATGALWAIRSHDEPTLTEHVMTVMSQQLKNRVWTNSAWQQSLVGAWQKRQEELADAKLEREVVAEQERKKETARQIAQRIKESKNEMKMDDEGARKTHVGEEMNLQDDEQVVLWETVRQEWLDQTRPFQLTLEILGNVTCIPFSHEDEDDFVMDDDEVPTLSPWLCEAIMNHEVPQRLVAFFDQLIEQPVPDLPPIVNETIADLLIKCTNCIAHCVGNIPPLQSFPILVWRHHRQAWDRVTTPDVREAMAATLATTLRATSDMVTDAADLDFLLSTCKTPDSTTATIRDAIFMLGQILAGRDHTAAVNHKVVQTLLSITTTKTTAMLYAEVLGVLMDIYGPDDCHPDVFASLQVLRYFQVSLPAFQQRIAAEQQHEEVEQWKEAASNAARFIQYKKGHL